MGATNRHNNQQAKHLESCRRSGKMAMLTLCGACDEAVVGVIMQKQNRYAIECKYCGYSAVAPYQQAK
jgi:DNA-directed RNA polymerase subunit RPC12/RpoP